MESQELVTEQLMRYMRGTRRKGKAKVDGGTNRGETGLILVSTDTEKKRKEGRVPGKYWK